VHPQPESELDVALQARGATSANLRSGLEPADDPSIQVTAAPPG